MHHCAIIRSRRLGSILSSCSAASRPSTPGRERIPFLFLSFPSVPSLSFSSGRDPRGTKEIHEKPRLGIISTPYTPLELEPPPARALVTPRSYSCCERCFSSTSFMIATWNSHCALYALASMSSSRSSSSQLEMSLSSGLRV